jgi:hypothetical protein
VSGADEIAADMKMAVRRLKHVIAAARARPPPQRRSQASRKRK